MRHAALRQHAQTALGKGLLLASIAPGVLLSCLTGPPLLQGLCLVAIDEVSDFLSCPTLLCLWLDSAQKVYEQLMCGDNLGTASCRRTVFQSGVTTFGTR